MEIFNLFNPSIHALVIGGLIGLGYSIYQFVQNRQASEQIQKNYRFELKKLVKEREVVNIDEVNKIPEDVFWEKIHTVNKRSKDSYKNFIGLLKDHLQKLNDNELLEYYCCYLRIINRANNHKLISAFQIINHAALFNEYHAFVSWLVSRGQIAFNNAINNPDLIRNIEIKDLNDITIEDLFMETYTIKSRKLMPELQGLEVGETIGDEIDFKDAPDIFPGLWDKYIFLKE
jgi:site-specific recombinase XerC